MRIWILLLAVLSATPAFGQTKPVDNVQKCRTILSDAVQDKNPDSRKNAAEAMSGLPVGQGRKLAQLRQL